MYGRARLSSDFSEIKLAFSIPPERPSPTFAPSWNVAPTDPPPIVRYDTKANEHSLDAIITTTLNELRAEIHNRMPAVLKPETWPAGLGKEAADVPHLKSLLTSYPADEMTAWPVSAHVGSVKNDDPSLIEPLAQTAH
jgi:putative SOS response-associated peptidase YedK